MISVKSLAVLAFFAPGLATAQIIACNIKTNGDPFVPPTIAFELDKTNKTGLVYDRNVHYVFEKPMAARVKSKQNDRWEFTWNLTIPANPSDAKVRYRAVVDLKKNTIQLNGSIRHATNDLGGRGNCEPRAGKLKKS